MRIIFMMLLLGWTCSFAAENTSQLRLWYHVDTEVDNKLLQSQISRFNTNHPHIQVETLRLPYTAFSDFLFRKAKEGDLPDLLYFQSGSLAQYVWSDMLIPLKGLVSDQALSNASSAMRELNTYSLDNKIYGLSQTAQVLTLYANTKLLSKAGVELPSDDDPWSLYEFQRALIRASAVTGKRPLDMELYYADDEWLVTLFWPFLQAGSGNVVSQLLQKKIPERNPYDTKLFEQTIMSFLENQWIVPGHKASKPFEKGRAAFALATTSHWDNYYEALGFDLAILPFPKIGPEQVVSSMSRSFGVTTQSEHPKDAAQFIEYMLTDYEVLTASDIQLSVPSTTSALSQSTHFGPYGLMSVPAAQFLEFNRPKPLHPAYPRIRSVLADTLEEILAGASLQTEMNEFEVIIFDVATPFIDNW